MRQKLLPQKREYFKVVFYMPFNKEINEVLYLILAVQ